jgi:hypothetical protein
MTKNKISRVSMENKAKTVTPKMLNKKNKITKKEKTPKNEKKTASKGILIKEGGKERPELDLAAVTAVIEAVKKMAGGKGKGKGKGKEEDVPALFAGADESKINLQVTGIKLPRDGRQQLINM